MSPIMAKKRTTKATPKLRLVEVTDSMTTLDPHLQQVIQAVKNELPTEQAALSQDERGEVQVDVLAKLVDPTVAVPGLTVAQTIGQIVTGTVAVNAIEQVRQHSNVISLKRATAVQSDLAFSVPEIRADAAQLQAVLPPATHIDGSGVIVGVVDYGCDFLHKNFRHADGSTRLLALWDQRGGPTGAAPAGYTYGREYTTAMINHALAQATLPPAANDPIYQQVKFPEDPQNRAYQQLGYAPAASPINVRGMGEHGTHVLDIAAGNGKGSGAPGVAPASDLIFVHLEGSDVAPLESIGNSRQLLEAVKYIFDKATAAGRPCVVNLSLGTHGGPHDGSTLVEQGFDTLLATPGRAIVLSAGNSWQRRSHASGQITAGAPRTLTWEIRPALGAAFDPTPNELEVWYPGAAALAVTLITPGGQRLGPVALNQTFTLNLGNTVAGLIVHRQQDPNNGMNQIDILLANTLPVGDWQVELTTATPAPVAFHAWIERDDGGQSQFSVADDDRRHTLGSISCGQMTIAVGSYDARHPDRGLSLFTAEGPTVDGRAKPEISAPGQNIQAAWSLTHTMVTGKSGTSMAAPHVTGAVALLLQAAGEPLPIAEIRQAIQEAARRNPPTGEEWHARYGHGRIDVSTLVAARFAEGVNLDMALAPVADRADQIFVNGNGFHELTLADLIAVLAESGRKAKAHLRIDVIPM
jgi:subtilisin family serine protease